jgi:hypothetical protein
MEVGYIPEGIGTDWIQEAKQISPMLSGLIKTKKALFSSQNPDS